MTRSVLPHTMRLSRDLKSPLATVFRAWSDPAAKGAWFTGPPDWESDPHTLDFRVGGRETSSGGPAGAPRHIMSAIFHEIVPPENGEARIISSFTMHVGETILTVSLMTLEFMATATGTQLKLTEQLVFLDGCDHVENREQGTNALLDMLEAYLNRQ
ncbi:MAG: SRPBCC family protein [Asticcacaulis sp.]